MVAVPALHYSGCSGLCSAPKLVVMSKSKVPTGTDVARLARVSKSAVSRAYNGGYVAPEVRERIFEAARKLRYRPSNAARALSTNRSNLIGLAITALDNQFYPELVDRLNDRLSLDGYRCVLFETRGEAGLEPVLDELLGFRLDGVIMASTSFATRVASECEDAGVPVIMLNNVDLTAQVGGVSADNRHGGEAVAQHFQSLGITRTAVINGLAESSASVERTAFFRDAMLRAGLPEPIVACGKYDFETTARVTAELLRLPDRPTGIFCVTDLMALSCLQAVVGCGLVPGEDVAVAGFDNVPIAAWPAFDLTTYAVPVPEIVETAWQRLISAIRGSEVPKEVLRVQGELVIRSSTVGRADRD